MAKAIDHHPARIESPDGIPHETPILPLLTGVAAYCLPFDPFSNDVIMNSGTTINPFDPTRGTIVASLAFSGRQFHQAVEDGKGHLFVEDNNGHLAFVDYDNSSNEHINGSDNFTGGPFLITHLDDIAPLSGAGSQPVPEPATMLLLGSGLIGVVGYGRKKFFEK
ncbi:MAG: PEP-CTERM sorting domain-containing protein [Thermodesulfobacteriota bacterium]|jgi:hypothetical protein